MSQSSPPGDHNETDRQSELASTVGRQAARKQKSRSERRYGLWFGLGMFGLVGWAVAVPTLAGIALGAWLDGILPARFSWKIALLFAGIILGCFNAWWWVRRESDQD
ncbi:MAG: AtpZ/AtpI family protein [Hyphomicrobiaceae bacterium]